MFFWMFAGCSRLLRGSAIEIERSPQNVDYQIKHQQKCPKHWMINQNEVSAGKTPYPIP